jgi:TolB-like protein
VGSLFDELKRRRVFRAVVAWGIFSFAALQATEPLMHGLGLPEWTLKLVVALLGLGFPVTILLSWTFDLRSTGIERTSPAEPSPGAPSKARLTLALVGLGLVVAAPGAAYLYFRASPGGKASPVSAGPPSIAVLPFADMSPGKDQEYFADGIAEEILNALAQVEGLHVAGRTSSFSFKGKGVRIEDIGRQLNVRAVLEGSVRKEGNRVRITAQLVNVADGYHVWSQTYGRELTGIFAVQDDIGRTSSGRRWPRPRRRSRWLPTSRTGTGRAPSSERISPSIGRAPGRTLNAPWRSAPTSPARSRPI